MIRRSTGLILHVRREERVPDFTPVLSSTGIFVLGLRFFPGFLWLSTTFGRRGPVPWNYGNTETRKHGITECGKINTEITGISGVARNWNRAKLGSALSAYESNAEPAANALMLWEVGICLRRSYRVPDVRAFLSGVDSLPPSTAQPGIQTIEGSVVSGCW